MGEQQASNPEVPDDVKRWTAKRKAAVILDILKGKTTAVDVARAHGLTVGEVEGWLDRFTRGGEEYLRARPRDVQAQHEAEKKDLHAKIGELALQVDVLKKAEELEKRMVEGDRS